MEASNHQKPPPFRVTSAMIIGGRTALDEVFLPISDSSCLKSQQFELKPLMQNEEGDEQGEGNEENCEKTSSALNDLLPSHDTEKSNRCYQASITSVIVIAFILLLVIFGHHYIKTLLLWIESQDIEVGCAIFLVLYIIISFPIAWGYILLMLAAGYLYGFLYGPLLVLCCASAGLFVSNIVMRHCCRQCFIAKFYSQKVAVIISVIESDQGFKVIALTRLTPIPFGLQNGLFALADISLFRYFTASVLGLMPMAILNCYMGSTLRSMDDVLSDESNKTTAYMIFGAQILVAIGLLGFVIRKARVELKKTVDSLSHVDNTDVGSYINIDIPHT
ncbi:hypothetical protein SNE40_007566 [Patella caerulea]|uniref:VTT domain-containing protein n=1 Tax=Patella caerulea TaxID=87958 RepID=A0AAN8K4U7_PATCE